MIYESTRWPVATLLSRSKAILTASATRRGRTMEFARIQLGDALIVEAVLTLDQVTQRTGQPVRRLRQWCATGSIRCERDGRGWLIPEAEIARVLSIAAARTVRGSNHSARALVVPRTVTGSANLQEQVARQLRIPVKAISISTLMIDGQPYLIAAWPGPADARASALAELTEQLDGELLD
jgi:hypothetical protein